MIQTKSFVKMTKSEYEEYSGYLNKLDAAETMIEIRVWQRKIQSFLDQVNAEQEKRKDWKTTPVKPVVKLKKEEFQEYNDALEKLEDADSIIEIEAWKRKIDSILNTAKDREYRELVRKARLYDELQAQ